MMLSSPKLKVIHVTSHIGLLDAIERIEPGLVERTIIRAQETLNRAGVPHPRIGVCGINPHAGEHGLFGRGEEESKIEPAVRACQARGWNVEGPLPADTLFFARAAVTSISWWRCTTIRATAPSKCWALSRESISRSVYRLFELRWITAPLSTLPAPARPTSAACWWRSSKPQNWSIPTHLSRGRAKASDFKLGPLRGFPPQLGQPVGRFLR